MKSSRPIWALISGGIALTISATGCTQTTSQNAAKPKIVVTTNVLGDVVQSMVGTAFDVTVLIPPNASPHDFQPSAKDLNAVSKADLVITNGAGFEQGLADVIATAVKDGTKTFEAISAVDTLDFAHHEHGESEDHEHGESEDHEHGEPASEGDHASEPHGHDVDPHFFTDPQRMGVAAEAILQQLLPLVAKPDREDIKTHAEGYIHLIRLLDSDLQAMLAPIPPAQRVLVTNHEVFGYFADRYDFEVVGTVIPSLSTSDSSNAEGLTRLAKEIKDHKVPAIFADTSAPQKLAETLAAEAGRVTVVELYSESLGPADSAASTYLSMMTTDAQRIAQALTPNTK